MAVTAIQSDLLAIEGNDETYDFTISYGSGSLNLTNMTPTFYLKASRTTSDSGAYTSTPTITDATLGQMTITIPRTQLTQGGVTLWYRIDVENTNSQINTVSFGNVTVLAV